MTDSAPADGAGSRAPLSYAVGDERQCGRGRSRRSPPGEGAVSSAACRDRGSSRTSPNGEAPPGLRSPAIRDPSSRRSRPLVSSHAHLSLASAAARLRSSFRALFNERASTACSPPTPRHDISCPAVAVSPRRLFIEAFRPLVSCRLRSVSDQSARLSPVTLSFLGAAGISRTETAVGFCPLLKRANRTGGRWS